MAELITAPEEEAAKAVNPPEGEKKIDTTPSKMEEEIPVRRSAAQYIIGRQKETIEKLRSKAKEDEEDEEITPTDEEGDSLTPEARTAVSREIEKRIKPLIGVFTSKADEDELQELLSSDAEAAKYAGKIRTYMKNPHYKGVPPTVIYHHLAFDAAVGKISQKRNVADVEARQLRGAGASHRPEEIGSDEPFSADDVKEMSDEEFEKQKDKAMSGGFLSKG